MYLPAHADGVTLALSPSGSIKATGNGEALQAAMASNVDGWIAYIQSQNATKH